MTARRKDLRLLSVRPCECSRRGEPKQAQPKQQRRAGRAKQPDTQPAKQRAASEAANKQGAYSTLGSAIYCTQIKQGNEPGCEVLYPAVVSRNGATEIAVQINQ